jgi:predicted Zn-dependent protease
MKKLTVLILLVLLPASASAFDIGKAISIAVGGVQQLAEAAKDITPAEEHYIGRSVSAIVLSRYPLVDSLALTKYVNEVGLTVAYASDRPSTYNGYHFAVVRGDEPNAYACPGGLIFVSTALLRDVKNEDQLAAVLSHEVAHVAHRHGVKAIKKSRWTNLGFYAVQEVGRQYTPQNISELVGVFQGVVMDVAKQAIDSGYSKADEKDADAAGIEYMAAAGYNPSEMAAFLIAEENVAPKSGPFSSHPKSAIRIKELEKKVAALGSGAKTESSRTARLKAAVAAVR